MSIDKSKVISIGVDKYYKDMVLIIGASGPAISVEDKDINDIKIDPNGEGQVLFYKQFGKYTVINGGANLEKQRKSPKFKSVSGHLISHISLKKARVKDAV